MATNRIHRALSPDGTEIAGRVDGEGPPLVFVNGTGDGDGRQSLVRMLKERFTCYSMSLRGRGLSGDHRDHSPERLVEDIATFVDSIGGPVVLAGHSRRAALALDAAAHAASASAIALYEPHVPELYGEDDVARVEEAVRGMDEAAQDGRLADAIRMFLERVALVDEDEMTVMLSLEAVEALAPSAAEIVRDISQWELPRPPSDLPLEGLTMPMLVPHGSETHPFYRPVMRHVTDRIANVEERDVMVLA